MGETLDYLEAAYEGGECDSEGFFYGTALSCGCGIDDGCKHESPWNARFDACERHYNRLHPLACATEYLEHVEDGGAPFDVTELKENVMLDPETAPRLEIDLVPSIAWGKSAAKVMKPGEWKLVRGEACMESYCFCVVCGKGPGPVSIDELWEIRDRVYTLVGFRSLCVMCHNSKHFGRAERARFAADARAHMKRINGWTDKQFAEHYAIARARFREANATVTSVDVSLAYRLLKICLKDQRTYQTYRRNWEDELHG